VHGLLVIAVAVVALAATTMLLAKLFNESSSPGPSWVRAGSVSEVQRRQVVYVPEARAFVVAASSTSPLALYARSPHLGERVRYCASSGWFEDRAHGAMFDGLGRYILGPAPRGLDRFEVRVIDGDVWVDTANLMLGPPRGRETLIPQVRCVQASDGSGYAGAGRAQPRSPAPSCSTSSCSPTSTGPTGSARRSSAW